LIVNSLKLVLVLVLLMACEQGVDKTARSCDPSVWLTLLAEHQARYPNWRLVDSYKLLHQATLGSEHAIAEATVAALWLAREMVEMGEGPPEPLVDSLGVDGRFARIHLRPWLARNGDIAALNSAFVATANHSGPDTAAMQCAIQALKRFYASNRTAFKGPDDASWLDSLVAADHAAVHHSPAYRDSYRPAYRVIDRALLPKLMQGME
jgi:hypothetical protein